MKKISKNIISMMILCLVIASCEDSSFELNYKAPLTIGFEGVGESNIVQVEKGIMSYTAKINVECEGAQIALFEIYQANPTTGERIALIDGTLKDLRDDEGNGVDSYSVEFIVDQLIENKCIKIVVTDVKGGVFERNLFVKITPSVLFTKSVKIETVENYYGPYFASWLDGRVYMRREGEKYKKEIDFSLGDIIFGADTTKVVPALVNPAERLSYNLLSISGLQQTKFESTNLTKTQFDAISQVDPLPITSLTDPVQDVVKLEQNKVYLFKTANGKKGLIYVMSLSAKTGTIENVSGEWIKNTPYYQAEIIVKVVPGKS